MSIQTSDYEKKKFDIFKNIYEIDNNYERSKYIHSLRSDLKNLGFISTMYKADIFKLASIDLDKTKQENARIVYELYPNLLNRMQKLASELKMQSSLELAMLCEFLMKEGYLSKNHILKLQHDGRLCMRGLLFVDIINGIGVCSNLAALERDFLNACGYNSSMILNYIPSNAVCFHESDEYKRNFNPHSLDYKRGVQELINYEILKNTNHMFTIIEEQGRMYAYDAANTIILELPNFKTAQIITGYGTCRMHHYSSIIENSEPNEFQSIVKLFERIDVSSPYNNNDFLCTLSEINYLISISQQLFNDFYDDAKPYIDSIAQESAKIYVKK